MLTAATKGRLPLFDGSSKLDILEDWVLGTFSDMGWEVQAWAVFANHYHVVGVSPESGLGLTELTQRIHRGSARELNKLDGELGRAVWYRCWDSLITFERSFLARLAYVHGNAAKHGLVRVPEDWKWCSAAWFARNAPRAFYETVMSFKTDRVSVPDDF